MRWGGPRRAGVTRSVQVPQQRPEIGDVAVFQRFVNGEPHTFRGTVVEADASGRWVKVRPDDSTEMVKIPLAGLSDDASRALRGRSSPFADIDSGYRRPGVY